MARKPVQPSIKKEEEPANPRRQQQQLPNRPHPLLQPLSLFVPNLLPVHILRRISIYIFSDFTLTVTTCFSIPSPLA